MFLTRFRRMEGEGSKNNLMAGGAFFAESFCSTEKIATFAHRFGNNLCSRPAGVVPEREIPDAQMVELVDTLL